MGGTAQGARMGAQILDRPVSELGRHPEHPTHRAAYAGIVAGYHAWDCTCGHRIFTEHGPVSIAPPWTGRVSSVTRCVAR